MRRARLWVCLSVLAVPAAPAAAQDPGVTIDPNSPSGKQYQVPLERARTQADPTHPAAARVHQGARGAAPLFGAGIVTGASGASSGTPSTSSAHSRAAHQPSSNTKSRSAAAQAKLPAAVRSAVQQPGAPSHGTILAPVGIVAAILGLGAGGGLLARRRA